MTTTSGCGREGLSVCGKAGLIEELHSFYPIVLLHFRMSLLMLIP